MMIIWLDKLHDNTARILLLRLRENTDVNILSQLRFPDARFQRDKITHLLIKHFTLRVQPITFLHQRIDLFPSLQNALNRLMQYNLSLV